MFYRYSLGDSGGTGISDLTVPWSEALVAFTSTGAVVFSRPLGGRHQRAEGIAITRDGILISSDESVNAAAIDNGAPRHGE